MLRIPQIIRYLIVGTFNTAVSMLLFAGLIYSGLIPEIALFLTILAGVVLSYFTTGRAVFGNKGAKAIYRYVIAALGLYAANAAALRTLIILGAGPVLAQAIIIPFTTVASYLILRSFVFRQT